MYGYGLYGEWLYGGYIEDQEVSYTEETVIVKSADENE